MEGAEVKAFGSPSETETDNNTKLKTFSEILDEYCAYYMSIGVTYDEFWFGDYTRLKFYVSAFKIKQEREFEQWNERLYLAGLYNYNAFDSVIGVFGWALGGKKGSRPEGYIEHPIAFTEAEKRAEKERNKIKTLQWFKKGQKGG